MKAVCILLVIISATLSYTKNVSSIKDEEPKNLSIRKKGDYVPIPLPEASPPSDPEEKTNKPKKVIKEIKKNSKHRVAVKLGPAEITLKKHKTIDFKWKNMKPRINVHKIVNGIVNYLIPLRDSNEADNYNNYLKRPCKRLCDFKILLRRIISHLIHKIIAPLGGISVRLGEVLDESVKKSWDDLKTVLKSCTLYNLVEPGLYIAKKIYSVIIYAIKEFVLATLTEKVREVKILYEVEVENDNNICEKETSFAKFIWKLLAKIIKVVTKIIKIVGKIVSNIAKIICKVLNGDKILNMLNKRYKREALSDEISIVDIADKVNSASKFLGTYLLHEVKTVVYPGLENFVANFKPIPISSDFRKP